MLGIDLRAARAVWTIFLFALAIATAYAIRETLGIFVVALFFAYMLTPVVDFVASRLPKRISRVVALAGVYLALVGLLITAGFVIGGRISDEAISLANRIPDLFQNRDWINQIPLPEWLEPLRERMIASIQSEFSNGGRDLLPYLTSATSKVVSGLSAVFFVILVPILAFFFLKDGKELRESLMEGVSNGQPRALMEDILNDIHLMLGQYIRALVLLCAATFVSYSLFFMVTGAPYAVLLAGTAAALEFIPVVGPLSAGAIVLVVTGVSGYSHLLWFFIFWIVYRLFQDYVLSPYLMSSGVELHPLLVLFGVLAGEQVAGVPGMFFSIPVIAVLRVIFVRAMRSRRNRELVELSGLS